MNLDIFFDELYFKKLSEFITLDKVETLFPFKEMLIDPDNLINEFGDATSIYNLLLNIHFFYYYSQRYVGYILLDNRYYIVFVDDEINVMLAGDDEVDWTKLVLDDDDYFEFKHFVSTHYNISITEPDYDKLFEVSQKHIDFN
jgi:hypothetical protein